MAGPYRDENESLRAEIERLETALGKRRRRRRYGVRALLLVLADFLAILALRPWLNGPSDVKFWAAVGVVIVIGVAAAKSAAGLRT